MLAYNPELNLHLRDHVIVCILATWPAGCGPPGGGASRLLLLACRQSVAMCGDATELGGMRDQRVQYSRPKFSPGSIALLQHGVSVAVVAIGSQALPATAATAPLQHGTGPAASFDYSSNGQSSGSQMLQRGRSGQSFGLPSSVQTAAIISMG